MAATQLDLIENRRSELQAAFLAFGSVSEQLSGAFDSLRNQVARLRADLGEAHAGRDHLAARLSALLKGLPGGVLVLDSRFSGSFLAASALARRSILAARASSGNCAAADSSTCRSESSKMAAKWCC